MATCLPSIAPTQIHFAANSSEIGFHSSAVTGHDSTSSAYSRFENGKDKSCFHCSWCQSWQFVLLQTCTWSGSHTGHQSQMRLLQLDWTLQQDVARRRTRPETLWTTCGVKMPTSSESPLWLAAKQPGLEVVLNPVDYVVWGAMQERIYHGRQLETVEQLKQVIDK